MLHHTCNAIIPTRTRSPLAHRSLYPAQVLQRSLPRPQSLDGLPPPVAPSKLAAMSAREAAEALLAQEMAALLASDAARYPPPPRDDDGGAAAGSSKKRAKAAAAAAAAASAAAPPLADYDLNELAAASELLAAETVAVRTAMGHADKGLGEYEAAAAAAAGELLWLPSKRAYGLAASASDADRVASLRAAHGALLDTMRAAARRAAKLDKKAGLVNGGLEARMGKLATGLEAACEAVGAARLEAACFSALAAQEASAAPARLARLREAVEGQRERELALQERYKELSGLKGDLLEELRLAAA